MIYLGGRVNKKSIFATAILFSNIASAQLLDQQYRENNAIALYDFSEPSGLYLDKSLRTPLAPLNLRLYTESATQRHQGTPVIGQPGRFVHGTSYLKLDASNILRSEGPATKINQACRASGAMSFEVWLENSESVQLRAGFDSTNANTRRPHPLRILNLARTSSSQNLYQRNFVFGQFYEMGNIYQIGVRSMVSEAPIVNTTNGVRSVNIENNQTYGRSLSQPLESTVNQTIIPDAAVGREAPTLQKIVYTVGPSGVQRLYLTDLNGNLYQASEDSSGFLGDTTSVRTNIGTSYNIFSNWFDDAHLSMGNVNMDNAEFVSTFSQQSNFGQTNCTNCEQHKSRFWKGKLRLVAIYCQELSREQVLGSNAVNSILQNLTNFTISTAAAPDALTQKALDIYSRLTGVKTAPSNPIIDRMVRELASGNVQDAAAIVTNEDSKFLNITVRDFAAKMSNRDQTVNTPLNDFVATVVGATRDDLDARRLLWDNITYMADPAQAGVPTDMVNDILRSNNHYQALDDGRFDLNRVLVRRDQQFVFNGTSAVANPQPSGLLTSRQWLMEHAIAGTNRRLIEYTFKIFLCSPMESIADASGPEDVIGPDIDRVPGGSATKFQTNCKACHTIMDGFRPAFARWTFGGGYAKHAYVVPNLAPAGDENDPMVPGMQEFPDIRNISAKINRNQDVYPDARLVRDDRWVNNAIYNANKINLAFDQSNPSIMGGSGTQSFGRAISSSKKFGRCMAERVFKQVCKRDVVNTDNTAINEAADEFMNRANNYNLKFLFQKIVTSSNCLGGQ